MKPWKGLLTVAGIRLVSLLLSCCCRLLFLLPILVNATLRRLATAEPAAFNREIHFLAMMFNISTSTSVQLQKQRLPLTCSFPVSLGSHLQSPHHPNHPSSHHGQGLSSERKTRLSLAGPDFFLIFLTFNKIIPT